MLCVDNVKSITKDLDSNFLINKQCNQSIKIPIFTSPIEIIGSHIYEKCGNTLLASIAYFSTLFNHFDWETCARIADERAAARKADKKREETEEEFPDLQELDFTS